MEQNLGIALVIGLLVIGRFLMRELRERRFLIARIYVVPAVLGLRYRLLVAGRLERERGIAVASPAI